MCKEKIAVVPGSFDPITNGHVNIVLRAKELYDKVYVAVMINDQKKYTFTLSEREAITRASFEDQEGIEIISSSGMLWELARDLGACAIVKGYRNEKDLEYEKKMALFNKDHYPNADTILLKSDETLTELSSTLVREKMKNGEDISDLLPQSAINTIIKITSGK